MDTQKNDPSKKGQTAQTQDKESNVQSNDASVSKRPQQGEEEEGTKLPGRETRTPVAGQQGDVNKGQDSGKTEGTL